MNYSASLYLFFTNCQDAIDISMFLLFQWVRTIVNQLQESANPGMCEIELVLLCTQFLG